MKESRRRLESVGARGAEIRGEELRAIRGASAAHLVVLAVAHLVEADGQALRTRFWTLYTQGVTRLLYEASRLYVNRFTSTAWEEVRFEVFASASSLLSS